MNPGGPTISEPTRPKRRPGRPPAGAGGGDTRTRILDHAARLLGIWGYAGTSMEDVAGAVGVTKKTLYHYFPSKDDLVFALSLRMLGEHAAAMTGLRASGPGARDRLLALVGYFAAHAPAPEVMRDVSRFLPAPQRAEVTRAFLAAVVAPIEAVVREGIASGEFSPHQDPGLAAWLVLGALSALPSLRELGGQGPDPAAVLANLVGGLSGRGGEQPGPGG